MADEYDRGNEISQASGLRLRDLRELACEALDSAHKLLLSESVPLSHAEHRLLRWHLFLDSPNDAIETCAISSAVVGLISSGESPNSVVISDALRAIRTLQLP